MQHFKEQWPGYEQEQMGEKVQENCALERSLGKIWSSSPFLRCRFSGADKGAEAQRCYVIFFILHLPIEGQNPSTRQNIAGLSKTLRLQSEVVWMTTGPSDHAHMSSSTCLSGWEMWLGHRWSAAAHLVCTSTRGGVCTTRSLSCSTTSTCQWSQWPYMLRWWLCSSPWSGMELEVALPSIPHITERQLAEVISTN